MKCYHFNCALRPTSRIIRPRGGQIGRIIAVWTNPPRTKCQKAQKPNLRLDQHAWLFFTPYTSKATIRFGHLFLFLIKCGECKFDQLSLPPICTYTSSIFKPNILMTLARMNNILTRLKINREPTIYLSTYLEFKMLNAISTQIQTLTGNLIIHGF